MEPNNFKESEERGEVHTDGEDPEAEKEDMMDLYDDNDVTENEDSAVDDSVKITSSSNDKEQKDENDAASISNSQPVEEKKSTEEAAKPETIELAKEEPIKEEPASAPPPAPVQSKPSIVSNRPQNTQNNEIEALNDEIATLLLTNKITLTTSSKLQSMLRENISLKEKVTKLKTLLVRSSKVSKENKLELDKAQREVKRLNQRVESLANRPTHMDLLADFETNFDRALMSLHSGNDANVNGSTHQHQQSGGEDTRPQVLASSNGGIGGSGDPENISTLLLTELSQTKSRMEHLETLNAQLLERASQMRKENDRYASQLERHNLKMSNLQLELRMAKMETENATREMKAKAASLAEMQMEIDLVTRSAMDANVRAAEGMQVAKSIKSDKAQVEELKAKVAALQEWAVASAEAKEAILEENKLLENRLNQLESGGGNSCVNGSKNTNNNQLEISTESMKTITLRSDNISPSSKGKISERKLWTKTSSLVVGAGMAECRVVELGENQVMDFETVILRWKFDITPSDNDIYFSMLKGKIDGRDRNALRNAHALIRQRRVAGGGGGEVQGAFVIQNACTLVYSNEHSWVRPRTIKYEVEAFAVL